MKYKKVYIGISLFIVLWLIALPYLIENQRRVQAEGVVNLLYTFKTSQELAEINFPTLQKILSKEAMEEVNINQERVTLTRYLKFFNKPTAAKIIDIKTHGDNVLVEFKVINEHIEEKRQFCADMEIGWDMKVKTITLWEMVRM